MTEKKQSTEWEEVDLESAATWGLVADKKAQRSLERSEEKKRAGALAKLDKSMVNKAIHAAGGEVAILDALGSGKTISGICEALGFSTSSFYDWVDRGGAARADAVSRARARGAHSLAEETVSIADALVGAESTVEVQVAKLRSDNRWRLAAKMNPDEYGDKQAPLVNIDLGSITLDALRKRSVDKPVHDLDEGDVS